MNTQANLPEGSVLLLRIPVAEGSKWSSMQKSSTVIQGAE